MMHPVGPAGDSPSAPAEEAGPPPSRRVVLRGAVAGLGAVVAGGLAGCGGDSGTAGGSQSSTAAAAGSSTAGSSAPAAVSSSAATTSGSASAAVLVATADVPVGGGIVVGEQKLVVTQPERGTFKAFSNICTHQNCPVTAVSSGSINCNCHGSKFSIDDGAVQNPPATAPLRAVQVRVEGTNVVRA